MFVGTQDQIDEARVLRKRMGGGMRQVGVLAAAGLPALDHHLERMAEDHEHARLIAEACGVDPATVDTNIVVVDVPSAPDLVAAALIARPSDGNLLVTLSGVGATSAFVSGGAGPLPASPPPGDGLKHGTPRLTSLQGGVLMTPR